MKDILEKAWEDRELLKKNDVKKSILNVIEKLDNGELRVASPTKKGWIINEWIKKAVILYFPIKKMETMNAGPLDFLDKIPL